MNSSPFAIRNLRLFILFRLCYNCRFYYPIFTILFLDYGLTLSQFALLNMVWAVTIVLTEVPFGALADTIGRKRLVVLAGVVMVIEMLLIALVPIGNSTLVFTVFLINRILSGLSEALASGADEALAYDSLVQVGDQTLWPRVLERLMRYQSLFSIVVILLGAALYDAQAMTTFASWFGFTDEFTQTQTMRLPIFATLILGFVALWAAVQMKEVQLDESGAENINTSSSKNSLALVRQGWELTLSTVAWIGATPIVLFILLYNTLFDHVIRMVLTMSSQYYRVIGIAEVYLGVLGVVTALLGLMVARLNRWLTEHWTPLKNLGLVAGLTIVGFWLLGLAIPYYGIIPMLILSTVSYMISFMASFYINRETDSQRRATVLSFKSMLFNLAYGTIGGFYALVVKALSADGTTASAQNNVQESAAFLSSMPLFLVYFCFLFVVLGVIVFWRQRQEKKQH